MIHARGIRMLRQCPKSYYFQEILKIKTIKDKKYFLSIGLKEAIKNWVYSEDDLQKILPDHPFLPIEKEEEINLLSQDLKRYYSYMGSKRPDKINITQDINVNGQLITVSADVIYVTGNIVEVVQIKRGAPKLSYKARSEDSKPCNNLDLFLLQLMGEHLYPGKIVVPAFHHLSAKRDKANFRAEFEEKNGYNIIKHIFEEGEEKAMMFDMLNETLNILKDPAKIKESVCDNCHNCSFDLICNLQAEKGVKLRKVRKVKKAEVDVELTPSQREAILFSKGGLRINAGAGSGKTTVIALRVAELIIGGCSPKDILTITFTNKGAREMQDRIEYWLEREGIPFNVDDLNVTTFNAWGDKFIQDNYEMLGFKEKPSIIEKVQKYDIFLNILKDSPKIDGYNRKDALMNYKHSKGVLPQLNIVFDYLNSQLVLTEDCLIGHVPEGSEENIFKIYEKYKNTMSEKNLIDYQDQIRMVLDIMENKPEVFANENYKHIIVDEYQDTDEQQVEMLMFLANQSRFESIMVVGDDAQAIYGFRNTSKENLMKFHEKFGEVKDIYLEHNFRSTPENVRLANFMNDLNKNKIEKKLISGLKPSGIKPKFITFYDKNAHFNYIADEIADIISKKKVKNSEIAVIARTKFELFDLERLLIERSIPYVIDIPEPLIKHPKVRMAEHLLAFIADSETTQGILEYIAMSSNLKDKDEPTIIAEIEKYKEEVALLSEDERLQKFFSMMDPIKDDVLEMFLDNIKKKELSFGETFEYVKKFIQYQDEKTIEKTGEKYNAVTLTTAHTSKGKEFEVVFVTIDKFSPISMTQDDVEEERRTLYVSLTRAKKKLIITYTQPDSGESMFKKEIISSNACNVETKSSGRIF